jgi:hypothetical protein
MGRRKLSHKKVCMSFVVTEEIRDYLRSLPNYSQYICDLIETDRISAKDLDDLDIDKELTKMQAQALIDRLFGGK